MADNYLDGLPAPVITQEIPTETILARKEAELVSRFPAVAPTLLLESSLTKKVLEEGAYSEWLLRQRVNEAFRANLLPYAYAGDLDILASFYDVIRIFGESDERLRQRVILAIRGRSPGGTEARYSAVAMGASLRVASVAIYTIGRNPTIYAAVFSTDNNGVPDAGLLATVDAALQAPDVRMVNDTIVVQAAARTIVNIAADVWLLPQTASSIMPTLESALRAAWAAESGLGFDLTRAWISARLMLPGVQRVAVTAPAADAAVPFNQAVALGSISLTNKGRDF
ncbi:baseplate J/gp47 family protein [Devosia ginsengisoli]|uniref:baseplate J/gp47 family protein n=1 Tax=Devosia ginsengisoli TaxID=400770 RepID=UPI0026F32567|nr:baseplate J/gp47 family protein [Devosia ginsengisoli]MCR6673230.1 baseplate J/gp47 family protein [Devosia ginsengisoli]